MVRKIFLILGITIVLSSGTQADSEKLLNPSNNHEYQRFDTAKSWYEAVGSCSFLDAYLVTITSQGENNWLIDNLIGEHTVWLGGTDNGTEGSWKWITGEPWDYTYWLQNEPNGENYLQYGVGEIAADGWNDWVSDGKIAYVCEWGISNPPVTYCVSTAEELHDALLNASSNYADDEIRIVQGNYIGNFVYASTEFNELSVLGGYTAGCSNRAINPSNTILDGNQINTVLALSAPDRVADFMVEGLTLRNGSRSTGNGGGIYANTIGVVLLENNIISNNNAVSGGGVYVSGNSTTMTSSTLTSNVASNPGGGAYINGNAILVENIIQSNTAQGNGGGLFINASGGVTLINNDILNNSLPSGDPYNSYGGGVYASANIISFINNIISGNETHAAMAAFGGGAEISANNASFINNSIQKNKSVSGNSFGGGAVGGGLSVGYGKIIFSDNIVGENNTYSVHSSIGAGIRIAGDATINNNEIFSNVASCEMRFQSFCPSSGGGVYLEGINSTITGNIIHNNTVTSNSNESFASGGGVYLTSAKAFLANNTILNNFTSSYGGG